MNDATRAAVEEAEWMAAQRREADVRAKMYSIKTGLDGPERLDSVIAVGDVVVLKSGGPEMTVCFVSRSDPTRIDVVWFADGKPDTASFSVACVRKLK